MHFFFKIFLYSWTKISQTKYILKDTKEGSIQNFLNLSPAGHNFDE